MRNHFLIPQSHKIKDSINTFLGCFMLIFVVWGQYQPVTEFKLVKEKEVGNIQKLTQLSPRSHPSHLVGKRTAQKDTIIDTTSDRQVNSDFLHRWSLASLTFNNYFYLFYITRITMRNNAPHPKLPKNQNRRAALGRPAMKLLEGFN